MGRFNLVTEDWIPVIAENGSQINVSMSRLFSNATEYVRLAGDMETQNFAILRMLLAVLQTVFSRYDAEGNVLVPVDDKMRQTEKIPDDEDAQEEYAEAREDSWRSIWIEKKFPEVLQQYLNVWKGSFFLFDEKCPFYQVTEDTMLAVLPKGKKASPVAGRFMNRNISESGNKTALFSPKDAGSGNVNKDIMTEAELARWLLVFQGYTGLSDKTSLVKKDQKPSKGWIYDLGGIFVEGENLFETLMLNCIPNYTEPADMDVEKPCWEFSGKEVLERCRKGLPVTNLAELYTNWSRAIWIDPKMIMPGAVSAKIAKLPALNRADAFVEPMTIWRYNETGDYKDHYTPKKHMPEQAMWRSFGLITLDTSEAKKQKKPGVLEQLSEKEELYGNRAITVHAVSMQDDGNATSWVPVDEIADRLVINDIVLNDENDDGWIIRINDTVRETKNIIEKTYSGFLRDISEIRNMDPGQAEKFISREREKAYQEMDVPFRNWLADIKPEDRKEKKILEWRHGLKSVILEMARFFVSGAGTRDLMGIEKDGREKNIVTAYLMFAGRINKMIS